MKDNNKNIELQTDNLITEKFHELLAANTKKLNDLRLEYAQRMADAQDDYDKAIDSVTIDEHLENDVLHIARKKYEKAREEYELNIRSLKKDRNNAVRKYDLAKASAKNYWATENEKIQIERHNIFERFRDSREVFTDDEAVKGLLHPGWTKDNKKGGVDGADKINVALNDDLGDDAVKDIGKLALMFGEDKTKGLRGAMLATGSAVNELAQNSSASAGYLVDFTARVAGVGKQAGFTQAQIMGLASVLDQNMQQDETAATAVQNLLAKMFQDSAKFAKIAGLNVKEFSKTLKEDANGALLQFLAALRSKGGFAQLAPMFEEMKMDGSRATGVLTVLADKLDDIKVAQDLATKSYAEGTSIINEFNTQNESVQAQLDKAKKKFQDLAIELGQKLYPAARLCISSASLTVHILSSIIDFVAKYRTTLITLTATIIALTVAETAHIVKLKAIAIWQNVVVTGAKKLWAILAAHPYLAVAAAVTTLVAVIVDLSRKTDSAAKAQEALNDIQREAQKEIVEEQLKLENLRKAAMNETNSLKDRYAAIAELNRIVPNYNASIDKTTGKYKENKRALDDYIKSLVHLYEVQGAKKKIQQLAEEKAELTIKEKQTRESYENAKKAGPGYN